MAVEFGGFAVDENKIHVFNRNVVPIDDLSDGSDGKDVDVDCGIAKIRWEAIIQLGVEANEGAGWLGIVWW
jgi:hypothetical protein